MSGKERLRQTLEDDDAMIYSSSMAAAFFLES